MQRSKPFASILLFLVCVLIIKFSSANKVENNEEWFKEIGVKRFHETSKIKRKPRGFQGSTNSLALYAETERLELENDQRRSHSKPVVSTLSDINEGIEPRGTSNPFSKTPNLNYPEKQNIINAERDAKETSLQSDISDIIGRMFPKDEANLGEFSNPRKRINKGMVSIHRIAKRNVNMSKQIPPTVTPTSNLSTPAFDIPPVCSGEKSCSGRCSGTITEWRGDESLECYCDTACYELFNDCCSDYTKYCGEQEPSDILIKRFIWTCEPLGHFEPKTHCKIGEGIWMVSRCADDWPHNKVRKKCEKPADILRKASNIKRYIPVVSANVTFRNYFCAKCNRIAENFEYFPVEIKTTIIPPEYYSFQKKLKFLLSHDAGFPQDESWRLKTSQKRRYCLKSIVDSCPRETTTESCTNGSVEPVSGAETFKNYECALCNDPDGQYSCFPGLLRRSCYVNFPQRFLLNLDYQNVYYEGRSTFSVLETSCSSKRLTFDHKLQECVQDIPPPSGNQGKIRVLAWFVPFKKFHFMTENDFKTVMKQYFGVEHSQIYNVSIETALKLSLFHLTVLFHLVSSTLFLTPEQIFDIAFETGSNSSHSNLRSFIYFEKQLSVTFNNITNTIIKTTFRPVSCNTRIIGYTLEMDDQQVIQIIPMYETVEYEEQIHGNITTCEEYRPRLCNSTQTRPTIEDLVINADLSLYDRDTGMLYKFGQYLVLIDNSVTLCNVLTCSSEDSCKGRCSNQTEWRTEAKMRCSCDPDCYEVFNDCCSDYTKYCGAQKPTETLTKKYNYTCEEFEYNSTEQSTARDGLWMVTQCRSNWTNETFRSGCEQAASGPYMYSQNPYVYLPVIGYDNTTFRNFYCAICNGVEKYEPWLLVSPVMLPEKYDFIEKLHFLWSRGVGLLEGRKQPWRPGANQARRYCLKNVIHSCPLGEKFESCTNGDIALITIGQSYYKNTHCAVCYGLASEMFSCFSGKYFPIYFNFQYTYIVHINTSCPLFLSVPFPNALAPSPGSDSRIPSKSVATSDEECGESGLIFDDILQDCRVKWLSPLEQNGQERLYVYSWLEPPKHSQNNSFTPTEFQESLARYLNISQLQLFDINITSLLRPETSVYLVASTITLTPQQSLELLFDNMNSSYGPKEVLNYIYFSQPFTLRINGVLYTVTKTTSRPLACVGKTTYTPEEYTLQDKERVFIRSTNKTYDKFEYYKENVEKLDVKRSNITVCEKYIPTKCNGSTVLYTTEEYSIMVNLSINVKKTSSLYDYGEYEILSNKSVAICQYFKVLIIAETRKTFRYNEVLGYITFVSFLLSILFLIFLLVTYILFPQLRTLPAKNLMNFAASLLFFQIFWLPLKEIRSEKATCKVMAIIEHYFLTASFVSMSVIAFHTCKVFARSLPAPKMSESHERKLFYKYLVLVWLLPGIFVGFCVVLDDQDVVKIGYGVSEICWLTEDNAYTYFVVIPIAVLLLFNLVAFVTAAIYLRKHGQNKAAKQASGNRRSNFLIYVKLSTLMGFTWLFGLLALVVKSATVFWYFFVIFTSLQGVFVAVAFVMNAKTFNLYKQRSIRRPGARKVYPTRENIPTNIAMTPA